MSVSLFEGIEADEMARALAGLERRRFSAGATVLLEGDYPGELYLVESGAADVFGTDRNGIEHHLARVGPGTTLGEMSLFTGRPASGTVRAQTELQVVVVSARALERLGDELPRVYRNIGAILAERLAASNLRSMGGRSGATTVLLDRGAPPDLAPALAASMAWHTRARVHLAESAQADEPYVLACVTNEADPRLRAAPIVEFLGPQGTPRTPKRRLAVRAWVEGPVRRGPDADGVVSIPPLSPADRAELARGALPNSTPAGAALGWVARDIAGLKVGLALGAGSYRGYAHIGVLQALEQIGLEPDYLAGTSIGAGMAGLHAMGRSAGEWVAILDALGDVLFRPTVSRRSLLSNTALAAMCRDVYQEIRIEDLLVRLAVVAADLETGREIVFRRGLLWLAVLASCSIPGIHPALRIGPYTAVDGGIVNPVPSRVATAMGADKVIAVKLGRPQLMSDADAEARRSQGRSPSAIAAMARSVELMQATMRGEKSTAAIVITPDCEDVPGIGLRRFSLGRGYVEAGEAAVVAALPRIAAMLPWIRS
jgi:predicted acylesterase/phospholipase RssA/CRP-like cAMP-binding protein